MSDICPPIKSLQNYIDKSSTQQEKFLEEFPEFDGRGVVIAVIDGCLDVSLPGLQETTTGLPKVIDCYDFTGNGNVDTSTVKKITAKNGILIGLTGRKLKIPSTWKNPSGKWHLGIKSLYELFDEEAHKLITKMRKNDISEKSKLLKESLASRMNDEDHKLMLEYLDFTESLSEDSLVADCIVWFNGKEWKACIDTSFKGALEESKVLTNFRDSHCHGLFFGKIAFCLTIHEEGNLLEIYMPFGDHGTLIATIASAHFPGAPEEEGGLAPGAQIISMAVLDPRKKEISASNNLIVKAFKKCLELSVNIINYSLGGDFPEEVYPIMKELAEKHGTLILKAAGNEGPSLFSIENLKPWANGMIFHIGSLDTTKTEAAAISPFSSCGPIATGSMGVTFMAPGHGAAANPRHFSEKQDHFEGTSCSTPNATGALACLISGLKANRISFSPYSLKLALMNTALSLTEECGNPLAYGNGIIQTDEAFKYFQNTNLRNNISKSIKNITFLLENARTMKFFKEKNCEIDGIFLKIKNETDLLDIYDFSVKIVVNFNYLEKSENVKWLLKISADSETFVTLSKNIQNNNTFFIQINANQFKFDSINYCEIRGFDSGNLALGCLFKFPITVIVPKFIYKNDIIQNDITLNSRNLIHSFFFCPPSDARHCIIKVCGLEEETTTSRLTCQYGKEEEIEITPEKKEHSFLLNNTDAEYPDTLEQIFGKTSDGECHEICFYLASGKSGKFRYQLQFIAIEKLNNYLNPFLTFAKTQRIWFRNGNLNNNIVNSVSIEFKKIKFELTAEKVNFNSIMNGENNYFILTYLFKISHKKTICRARLKYYGGDKIRPFQLERIQIFTASKKFITGFCGSSKKISLSPGNYVAKALFEYDNSQSLQKMFPFLVRFPVLLVKEYFEESLKPALEKCIQNETLQIRYNSISTASVSTSSSIMPFFSQLKGIIKIEVENVDVYFSLTQRYSNFGMTEFAIIKEYFQSFLPYSAEIEKALCNISPEEMLTWHEKLKSAIYSKQNNLLLEAVEAFLEAVNSEYFFNIYNKIKDSANAYEKGIMENRKNAIIEGYFIRADTILNDNFRGVAGIPKIFRNNFGHKLFVFKGKPDELHCNIVTNLWSFLSYDIYPPETGKINKDIPEFSNDKMKNAIPDITEKCHIKDTKKENLIENACEDFLQKIVNDDFDPRKDLIIAKKAILFGNFGTALFHLNKLATENFSNPDFKIFDEAIIEMLKNLGWSHLVEAHENSMLDKHRSYYRPF